MIDVVFFSNITGNTERFVNKITTTGNKIKIPIKGNDFILPVNPFVIITPTYGDSEGKGMVPHQVKKFLKQFNQNLLGVISAGNRNFGKEFGLAGDIIAYKFKVPLLYKIEIAGLPTDVEEVNNILKELENKLGEKK